LRWPNPTWPRTRFSLLGEDGSKLRICRNDKEQLRQALCAALPHDLASDLDDEYRDAVNHVIDQFRTINAINRTNE
jgi:hypothetical protein